MKRLSRAFLLVLILGLVSGCKSVDLVNGEIPAEYISSVGPLLGTYSGIMKNGKTIRFDLELKQNKISAKLREDFLGENCGAELGLLKSVSLHQDANNQYHVDKAVFAFDPNKCADQMEGREVELSEASDAIGERAFDVELRMADEYSYDCSIFRFKFKEDYMPPCKWSRENTYLRGRVAQQR